MAIVRLGPIVAGISGKVGNVVFVNGRSGLVVRPAPITVRKTSDFLLRAQGHLSAVRRRWATLTEAQRLAWCAAAAGLPSTSRLGQTRPRSGFQYFVLTNTHVFLTAPEILPFPPIPDVRDNTGDPTCVFSVSSGLDITVFSGGAPLILRIEIFGWPFWVNHDTNSVARFVFLSEHDIPPGGLAVNVTSDWEEHFGPVQLGQRYACATVVRFSAYPFVPKTIFRQTVVA